MALGLRRICSTDDFFNKRLNALTIHLINGGYKHCFIQQEINKVSLIPLSYPLETSPRQETDGVAFVVIFNPVLSNKNHVISDNLNILHSLQRCKEALPSPPLISYRRCNRHDILVRAKHRRPLPKTPGAFRCNRSSCKTCFFLTEKTTSYTLFSTNEQRRIRHHISCLSSNLRAVYKTGTGTRGRGYWDACVWGLGTWGDEGLRDIKYGTWGRVGRERGGC